MSDSNRSTGTTPLLTQPRDDIEGEQNPTSENPQGSDSQPKVIAGPIKQAIGPDKTIIAQPQARTEQPDPYQLRDLKAQEEVAYWAMCMFVAAVFTFAVTSIGTLHLETG